METDINAALQTHTEATDKPSWLAKNIPYIIALFVLAIWGSVTLYIIGRFLSIIATDPKVDMTSLLALYTGISLTANTVIGFYFGSSSSSQKKDDTIKQMASS